MGDVKYEVEPTLLALVKERNAANATVLAAARCFHASYEASLVPLLIAIGKMVAADEACEAKLQLLVPAPVTVAHVTGGIVS
jgi:hypothetical protein